MAMGNIARNNHGIGTEMTLTREQIIEVARSMGVSPTLVGENAPASNFVESLVNAAYVKGVEDARNECVSLCDELEEHYADYASTALLNGDIALCIAASGEPRAARFIAQAIRELAK